MDIDTLYQQYAADPRPLPLIIAELWQFPLAYIEKGDGIWYAVSDWLVGVAELKDNKAANNFWRSMKRRVLRTTGIDLSIRCQKLRYRAKNGKIYRMDYVNSETLFSIVAHMSSTTGIASYVLNGEVPQTKQLRKPQHGQIYLVSFMEISGYYKIGKSQDVQRRIDSINTNVPFTIKLDHVFESQQTTMTERKLHCLFASKRIKLEWFALETHDVNLIKSISSDDDLERILSTKM